MMVHLQADRPSRRKQLVGTLTQHDGAYYVEAGSKEYHVLLASVTFFKGHVATRFLLLSPRTIATPSGQQLRQFYSLGPP